MKPYLLASAVLVLAVLACSLTPVSNHIERTKDDAAILTVNTPVYIHTAAAPTPGSWMYPINELKREGKP